jgi:Zinc finger, C3HC4 type (RING finger)
MVTDREVWSNLDGTEEVTRDSFALPSAHWRWVSDWEIDPTYGDRNGWQYAFDFKSKWSPHKTAFDFVRRRRWIRTRIMRDLVRELKEAHHKSVPPETQELADELISQFGNADGVVDAQGLGRVLSHLGIHGHNTGKENDSQQHVAPPALTRERSDPSRCICCEDETINSVFVPCGHTCFCYKCACDQAERHGKCAICAQVVESTVRTYAP